MQLRKLPVALMESFRILRRGEVLWVLLVGCCWLLVVSCWLGYCIKATVLATTMLAAFFKGACFA